MKYKILIFSFSHFPIFSFCIAQQNKIDSLANLLATEKSDTSRVNLLTLLASSYMSINPEKSIWYAEEGLKLSQKINFNGGLANAFNALGNIYSDRGNYPLALDAFLKSLKVLEEIQDKKKMASTLNNIGILYQHMNNFQEALKSYLQSLKIKEELGDFQSAAASYNNIGELYRFQEKNNEALKYYFLGLKISEQLNDKRRMGEFYNNIGIIYDLNGEFKKALDYYAKSMKIDAELGNSHGIAAGYVNIGYVCMGKGDYKEAFDYFDKGIELSKELQYTRAIISAYEGYYETYMKMGNYKNALEYYRMTAEAEDSILNVESSKQVAEMQTKYETEKKETQIALQKSELEKKDIENKKQKIIIWLVIGSLLIVIIAATIIFRSFSLTKKQNKIIEYQKILVEKHKHLLEEKNKDITDSITYAKRLQRSFLPTTHEFDDTFRKYFVLYRPRDIVSGDFYWLANVHTTPKSGEQKKVSVLAVADCTGHGVPGAFMSMIGNTLLNQTIKNPDINSPAEALDYLNSELPKNLKKHDVKDVVRDGMDIVICAFDFISGNMYFSGANNPIYRIRNKNLIEQRGDNQPISASDDMPKRKFTNYIFDIKKNDVIYLFTDGYADQFGGPKGKKFKYSQLEKLLLSIHEKSMQEQKDILNKTFDNWKGQLEQIDDICIIGVRV